MITTLIISSIFLLIAAAANAVMDTITHHYSTSIFEKRDRMFWNPAFSWRNKYKDGYPQRGAKFPGSTTIFVFVTDAWHLFKFIMLNSYLIAFSLPAWLLIGGEWWVLIAIFGSAKTLHSGLFNLLYHKTLITNSPP